jgi:hypothetical protein
MQPIAITPPADVDGVAAEREGDDRRFRKFAPARADEHDPLVQSLLRATLVS